MNQTYLDKTLDTSLLGRKLGKQGLQELFEKEVKDNCVQIQFDDIKHLKKGNTVYYRLQNGNIYYGKLALIELVNEMPYKLCFACKKKGMIEVQLDDVKQVYKKIDNQNFYDIHMMQGDLQKLQDDSQFIKQELTKIQSDSSTIKMRLQEVISKFNMLTDALKK